MNHFYGLNKEKKTTPSWIQKVCVCGGNYIRYIQPFRPVCLGFPEREMKIYHSIFHLKKKKTTKNLKQYCLTLMMMMMYPSYDESIHLTRRNNNTKCTQKTEKQKSNSPHSFFFHFISYGHIHPNQIEFCTYICV